MPQYPSQTKASGIYGANQVAELIRGNNFPTAAPTIVPSSVTATQISGNIQVAFTAPSLNSTTTQIANPNPTASDFFGSCIASFGNWVAVGAPEEDLATTGSGSVYLYYLSNGTYTLKQRIDGSVSNGKFGSAIDMYGDLLVIGAPGTTSPIVRGAVYIYQITNNSAEPWALRSTLGISNILLFGTSVSTDGIFIAIGTTNGYGAVYVYKRGNTASTWVSAGSVGGSPDNGNIGYSVNIRDGHLLYTRGVANYYIGQAVSHYDNYLIPLRPIYTPGFSNSTPFNGGLVRFNDTIAFSVNGSTSFPCVGVYKRSNVEQPVSVTYDGGASYVDETYPLWYPVQTFFAPTNSINFGASIAINENELAIGADISDVGGTDTGFVNYYSKNQGENLTESQYVLVHQIQASSVQANGRFGSAVAFNINGKPKNYLWIGERQRTVNGAASAGSVWTVNPQIQFCAASSPNNVFSSARSSPVLLPLSSFTAGNTYSFNAATWTPESGAGASVSAASTVTVETRGESTFLFPGTYTWICPPGVTTVAAVAVGAGAGAAGYRARGGGGGALAYRNNISVTPGQAYTIVVAATTGDGSNSTAFDMIAGGGRWDAGGYQGGVRSGTTTGGGNGGNAAVELYDAGNNTYYWSASLGGGGAGGYSGNGGNAGGGTGNTRTDGSGGAGAGGQGTPGGNNYGVAGGGVGIYGQGTSGIGVSKGGSGGEDGGTTTFPVAAPSIVGQAGRYGSGAWAASNDTGGYGGHGAVRIIWGTINGVQRAFPSTGAGAI